MRSRARSSAFCLFVALALGATACAPAAPAGPSSDDELSPLVRDAYPCPYGMLENILEGHADPVSELPAKSFDGPVGFPGLTEGYTASCVFRYETPTIVQAYFIGMGPEFVLEMAERLKKYGFALVGSNNDLPEDWSLDGLQVSVDRRFANDVSIPRTTFDRDFVVITLNE